MNWINSSSLRENLLTKVKVLSPPRETEVESVKMPVTFWTYYNEKSPFRMWETRGACLVMPLRCHMNGKLVKTCETPFKIRRIKPTLFCCIDRWKLEWWKITTWIE